MKPKNKEEVVQLFKRCGEILHYIQDSIGVPNIPEAKDGYYSYPPHVFKLLNERADKTKTAESLDRFQKDTIEFSKSKKVQIKNELLRGITICDTS